MSYVYFVRGVRSKLVKIGVSTDLAVRFKALEATYKEPIDVLFVIAGSHRAENEYHRRFAGYRERGEWFREEGAFKKFIEAGMKSDLYKKLVEQDMAALRTRRLLDMRPKAPPGPRLMGYARVSTEDQVLDVQITKLREAGIYEDDLFVEKVSAVSAKRPAYSLMRKQIQAGDTLILYSFSRLSRDLKQLLTIVDELKAEGVGIKSITEPHIDPYTTNGRLLISVTGAVDENERGRVRDRTRDAMQEKKRQGMYLGRPIKVTEAVRAKARKMKKSGMAVREIARELDLSTSAVYGAL